MSVRCFESRKVKLGQQKEQFVLTDADNQTEKGSAQNAGKNILQ